MNPRDIAINAAKKAGKAVLALTKKGINVTSKNSHDILAEADLVSEKIILDHIKKYFPDHGILSEERGIERQDSDYLWVVDPLDGTINFSRGFDEWCISIGLEYKGERRLAVVYQPVLKKLYVAQKGMGATLNGTRIAVSLNNEPLKSLVATDGTSKVEARKLNNELLGKLAGDFRSVRIFGAGALGLCKIAEGKLDAYFRATAVLHYWDYGAAALIITEAGGKVTDIDGGPFSISSRNMLATNGILHQKVLQLIHA